MKIAIVTDSTADIPSELVKSHDLHVVPAILVLEGRSLVDGEGITREELYLRLPSLKASPTTAAPSSGSFHDLYTSLLNNGIEQIISIHISSLLSGIYNAAAAAAKSFENRVHVVDSLHVTMGLGFQVLAAAQAAATDLSIREILSRLEDVRRRTHLVAMLDTLEYARRSGRISWAKSSLSSLLQIKPFLGIEDGKVTRMGETRTRQKGIERLYQMLAQLGSLQELAVLHTNAEPDASQFVERAEHLVSNRPLVVNVTSIIGVHVGPNGLGFVAVTA